MDWFRRETCYDEIVSDLGISKEGDAEAARELNEIIGEPNLKGLESLIKGRLVNVFGAGPSLEGLGEIPDGRCITADGATSFLVEKGVTPDIVVTDLDGRIEDIQRANQRGAIVVLHAHGDNIEKVRKFAGRFRNPVGTAQVKPFGRLLNFGGFTDGDRAVYLAEHFKPSRIRLYGMDFDETPGKYSFTPPARIERKMKKLKWAKKLIQALMDETDVEITFY